MRLTYFQFSSVRSNNNAFTIKTNRFCGVQLYFPLSQAFDREEGAIVASQHGKLPGDAAQWRDRPEDVREGDRGRLALPRGARLHLHGRREHRRIDGEAEKGLLRWARGAPSEHGGTLGWIRGWSAP